jgi:lactam utilization protein B
MSSSNFDLEANLGEGSGENRLGLDEEAVEEVRRIM